MFESFVEEFVKKLCEVIPGLAYTYETSTTTYTLKHSSRSLKDVDPVYSFMLSFVLKRCFPEESHVKVDVDHEIYIINEEVREILSLCEKLQVQETKKEQTKSKET